MIAEEALHFWGDYYVAAGLHQRGVLFEAFLAAPHEIAAAFERQREALASLPSNVTSIAQARRSRLLCARCRSALEPVR